MIGVLLNLAFSMLAFSVQDPRHCNTAAESLSFVAATDALNGNNVGAPTSESIIARYAAETGVKIGVRTIAMADDPSRTREKLFVQVTPQSLPRFLEMLSTGFPNLLFNYHPPNNTAYNYLLWRGEFFTRSGMQAIAMAEGAILPAILLSNSEAARLHDYLYLLQKYGSSVVYPWTLQGYNYPSDPYYNCGSWPPHIPLGDPLFASVLVHRNAEPNGGQPAAREGILSTPTPPANLNPADREIFGRVWSAPIHQRLFDVLGMSWEEGDGSSSSNFAQALSVLAGNDRVPFIAIYTSAAELPNPVNGQFHRW